MVEIEKQNEVIISLLARQVFGENKIRELVSSNKRDAAAWVRGYNACDGKCGVSEIAKVAGVAQPSATTLLKSWENLGIVINFGSETKPLYKRLMRLSEK